MDNKKTRSLSHARELLLIWVIGIAGQLCWNLENFWFNTFVYKNIGPYSSIVGWMVAISAIVTTFSTFFFGTISDRSGKRKHFIWLGYVIWGFFTIVFGFTGFLSKLDAQLWLVGTMVVLADSVMSFFGSMGNDSGFNAWIADIIDNKNKGSIGAALAIQPVIGTIIGTILGGLLIQWFGYMAFFAIMGIMVSLIGLFAFFFLTDSPNLKPNKKGSFWSQFLESFDFRTFSRQKELMLVNILAAIFFIGFNVYFVHIGNLFIYNYGFSEGDAGIIQGLGLIIAIIFTIPAGKAINNNKSPLITLIALIVNIVGLLELTFFAPSADSSNLISIANIPLLIGVIVVGTGYVLFMQTAMVWNKSLYPEGTKGRFEGIRVIFFVLIPMVFGSLIANPLIQTWGKDAIIEVAGVMRAGKAPSEVLFIAAEIITLFAFIPLYFVNREFKKRIANESNLQVSLEE